MNLEPPADCRPIHTSLGCVSPQPSYTFKAGDRPCTTDAGGCVAISKTVSQPFSCHLAYRSACTAH